MITERDADVLSAWAALVEYRERLDEEDPAVQRLNRMDPYVVASIFSAGYRAACTARMGSRSEKE